MAYIQLSRIAVRVVRTWNKSMSCSARRARLGVISVKSVYSALLFTCVVVTCILCVIGNVVKELSCSRLWSYSWV